jgi:hypothetical protein
LTRTDANKYTAAYSYDALNRVKQLGYDDGNTYREASLTTRAVVVIRTGILRRWIIRQ